MRFIESEGDSIDEAIEKALQALQVERQRVQIEILSDATRGLFGFGGRKARVRATVRAPLGVAPVGSGAVEKAPVPRGAPVGAETPVAASPPPARPTRGVSRAPAPQADSPELAERARTVLGELLSHLGVGCSVSIRDGVDAGTVLLEVSGDGSGLVIGRRGQTLDAVEYMVNRAVARDESDGALRIVVDVERYRERRRESLEQLAHRLAAKAKETGRVVTLNPMSPRDRRIVHLALQGDPAVTTRSQGGGYYRKMLLLPADRRPGPHQAPQT